MELISRRLIVSNTLYCCYYLDCNNTYITKYNLKHHIETIHLKAKKFECDTCKKNLSSKQNLIEHMKIHNGAKPHACNYCGKTYRKANQLTLHKRVHAKDGDNEVVEEVETAPLKIARVIMKEFENISWEELESIQPQLPVLQNKCDREMSLPSFDSVLKKCKKDYYI